MSGNLMLIAKARSGELIKVYQFDGDDFETLVSGCVAVPKIFASSCGGVERAMNRAAEINGLQINEIVFAFRQS